MHGHKITRVGGQPSPSHIFIPVRAIILRDEAGYAATTEWEQPTTHLRGFYGPQRLWLDIMGIICGRSHRRTILMIPLVCMGLYQHSQHFENFANVPSVFLSYADLLTVECHDPAGEV